MHIHDTCVYNDTPQTWVSARVVLWVLRVENRFPELGLPCLWGRRSVFSAVRWAVIACNGGGGAEVLNDWWIILCGFGITAARAAKEDLLTSQFQHYKFPVLHGMICIIVPARIFCWQSLQWQPKWARSKPHSRYLYPSGHSSNLPWRRNGNNHYYSHSVAGGSVGRWCGYWDSLLSQHIGWNIYAICEMEAICRSTESRQRTWQRDSWPFATMRRNSQEGMEWIVSRPTETRESK